MKILLVEDEVILRKDLRLTLESWGHTVVGETDNGEQALELVRERGPDLIILDIKLREGMTGLDLLEEFSGRETPRCIVITAYPTGNLPMKGTLKKSVHVLSKPLDMANLSKIINEL
jgi:YesN/AraC family two-component response regulator